jgi:hypothetical protein
VLIRASVIRRLEIQNALAECLQIGDPGFHAGERLYQRHVEETSQGEVWTLRRFRAFRIFRIAPQEILNLLQGQSKRS